MSKYILLYKGPATPVDQITPEIAAEQTELWNAWMGKVGSAMTDFGAPFGDRGTVKFAGVGGDASDLNGYSIVEADSLDSAKALCDGHPFLSDGTDRFSIEVYELAPVPM